MDPKIFPFDLDIFSSPDKNPSMTKKLCSVVLFWPPIKMPANKPHENLKISLPITCKDAGQNFFI